MSSNQEQQQANRLPQPASPPVTSAASSTMKESTTTPIQSQPRRPSRPSEMQPPQYSLQGMSRIKPRSAPQSPPGSGIKPLSAANASSGHDPASSDAGSAAQGSVPLGRSSSIHSHRSTSIGRRPYEASPPSGNQTPGHAHHHSHGSRHWSQGSVTTRPAIPLSTDQRNAFEEAVAGSSLASTSSGLQALLRDHPELVSSELAKAAGTEWSQLNESARGSQGGTGPPTPGDNSDDGGVSTSGRYFDGAVPDISEGGHATMNTSGNTIGNLGSAGE